MGQLYTGKYWRQRAEEARAVALRLRRPDRRRIMLDIATGYELMASMADRFASSRKRGETVVLEPTLPMRTRPIHRDVSE